jgi:hypothetical protein
LDKPGFEFRQEKDNCLNTRISRPNMGPSNLYSVSTGGYFTGLLRGKGGRCVGLANLPNLTTFMFLLYRNSGTLNLLQPYGPLQARNGPAYFMGRAVDPSPYLSPRLRMSGAIPHRKHSLSQARKHIKPATMPTKYNSLTHINSAVQSRL